MADLTPPHLDELVPPPWSTTRRLIATLVVVVGGVALGAATWAGLLGPNLAAPAGGAAMADEATGDGQVQLEIRNRGQVAATVREVRADAGAARVDTVLAYDADEASRVGTDELTGATLPVRVPARGAVLVEISVLDLGCAGTVPPELPVVASVGPLTRTVDLGGVLTRFDADADGWLALPRSLLCDDAHR